MSSSTPIVTTENLIRSAQAAIRDRRLGIQHGATEPMLLYPDGTICTIAAALPQATLEAIVRNGNERLNWLALKREEYFGCDTLQTVEVLSVLQLRYDNCCSDEPADDRAAETREYCAYVLSLDLDDLPNEMQAYV